MRCPRGSWGCFGDGAPASADMELVLQPCPRAAALSRANASVARQGSLRCSPLLAEPPRFARRAAQVGRPLLPIKAKKQARIPHARQENLESVLLGTIVTVWVWSGRHRRPGPWALPLPFNPIKADRMSHGRRKTLTGSRSLHVLARPFCPSLVAGTTDCTGKISPPTREGQEGGSVSSRAK
jgi:hypothetical protein